MHFYLFSFIILFTFGMILVHFLKSTTNKVLIQDPNVVHKEDKDWWYSVPHYWVLSNGDKINLAEYITWEDYKNMSKESKAHFYAQLENRLLYPIKQPQERSL